MRTLFLTTLTAALALVLVVIVIDLVSGSDRAKAAGRMAEKACAHLKGSPNEWDACILQKLNAHQAQAGKDD